MELLLKRDIEKLGRVGDLIQVKSGYGRNYLLPRGLAVPVTAANKAQIEKEQARLQAEEEKRLKSLKEMAEKLSQVSVTVEGRANEEGHLFGSVTTTQIARAVREKGYPVEDRMVRLEHPLKEIGVFDVKVHLHADLESTVKVWVVQAKPS